MGSVVRPLGDLATTLPAGPEYPGRNGSPSFELFYDTDYVLPHREAAWILLTERIQQAAEFCTPAMPCAPRVADRLGAIRSSLNDVAQSLAAHLPPSATETPAPAEDLDSLLSQAKEIYRTNSAFTAHPGASLSSLAAILTSAYQALPAPASSPVPAHAPAPLPARIVARLVHSVLRPLADSLSDLSSPATPGQPAAQEPAPQKPAPSLWDVAVAATDLRVRLGAAAPAGLLEAVAALQDVAVEQAPAGERAQRISELEQRQRGLPTAIVTAANGPYLVTNVAAVRDHLGTQLPVPPQLALCRCGGSSLKPFCDGRTSVPASPAARTRTGCPTSVTPTRASRSRSSTTGASASTPVCVPTGWPPCSVRVRSPSSRRAAAGWTRSSGRCATARPGR